VQGVSGQKEVIEVKKIVLLKISETQAIEVEGNLVYIDENVAKIAKPLPAVVFTQ
jgi:hypothetical protein